MDTFGAAELRKLTDAQQGPCVTIFMPTHITGSEAQQDTLRLKNLLSRAERSLTDQGLRGPEAKQILAPARDLLSSPDFWEKRSSGLAAFLAEGAFYCYRVPVDLDESVVVNRRFQVKPLFPLLKSDDHFFLLALSQKRARLFEGAHHRMDEVEVEGMPPDMASALNLQDVQDGTQVHPASRAGMHKIAAHGHGGGRDECKEEITQYFRLIDTALHKSLRKRTEPLILAGVQYLLPIYRQVSGYPHVACEELPGNPDHLSAQQLHERAWPLIEQRQEQTRVAAVAKYDQLAGTGKTSQDVSEIVTAAHQGRVETLLVDVNAQQWGEFRPGNGEIKLREQPEAGDDDLLDLAAVQTLLNRGDVYAVPADQSPAPPLAAVFRY